MSQCTPACNEPLAEMRADPTLRTLVELDSLEPSRALDRAVLGLAREAASGRAPSMGPGGRSLRWGFPAAVAAAAVCAIVVQRTASSPRAPIAAAQFFVERMQSPRSEALEMVRVSAHYRGDGAGVGASGASGHLARSDLGETHGALIPSFIFASAPLLSIGTAPMRKHGTEEQTPRAATRSSDRASRRDRDSTTRRRMRQPGLFDSVDLSQPVFELQPAPLPPPALESAVGAAGRSARVRAESNSGAPAGPH